MDGAQDGGKGDVATRVPDIAVRLANSLVRESHVCIWKIFCICKEGYHLL